MKQYHFGDVVLTNFPYIAGGGAKQRPALVLIDTGDDDLILAAITSKTFRKSSYDVTFNDWKKAQLLFPSTVRVHKILTQEKGNLTGLLGQISQKDSINIQSMMKKLFAEIL